MFYWKMFVMMAVFAMALCDVPSNLTKCAAGAVLTSSNNCVAVLYIEGCYQYESYARCAACEFNYDLIDGRCDYNQKEPSRCCLQFGDSGDCTQCEKGLFLDDGACKQITSVGCIQKTGSKCLNCATNYYLINDQCQKGVKGCASYNPNGQCLTCRDGFQFSNGTCSRIVSLGCTSQQSGTCSKCYGPFAINQNKCIITNCTNANEFGCVDCQDGFYLRDGVCVPHIKGCHYYVRGKCGACHSGYVLTKDGCVCEGCNKFNDNYECQQCLKPFDLKNLTCTINNCLSYRNNTCVSCIAGYHLKGGQCIEAKNCTNYIGEVCRSCAPQFYLNKSLKCSPYDNGCVEYASGQCTICSSPFEITSDGLCLIDGCLTNDNTGCLTCAPAYQISGKICQLPNCQKARKGVCQTCSKGYIVKDNLCSQNDVNCVQYSDNGACYKCADNFHPDAQGKCKPNQIGCVYAGSDCTSCVSPFTFANGGCNIANCKDYCKAGCANCSDGFFVSQGVCNQKQPGCLYNNGSCTSCSAKFTFSNGQCLIEGCSQYATDCCSACSQPYNLANGICVIPYCSSTSNGQCSICNDGYNLTNTGNCQRYIQNCTNYDGNNCQTCQGGYYLSADKQQCLQVASGCIYRDGLCTDCSDGYAFDTGVCYPVDKNCINQTKDRKCSVCRDTFYIDNTGICKQGDLQCQLFNLDGTCNTCKNSYYINEIGGCSQKLPGCNYTNGKCASCYAPFVIKNQTCQILGCNKYCNQGCLQCDTTYTLTNFTCEINNATCSQGTACNVPTNIKNCQTYTNGVCVACVDKFFLWTSICFPFAVGCLRYDGKSCIACTTNYKLSQGICVKTMADWSFGDLFTKKVDLFTPTTGTAPTVVTSKLYAPGSSVGRLIYSSLYNFSYLSYNVNDSKTTGVTGWKAKNNASGEWVGLTLSTPQTFYQVQIQSGDNGAYVTDFTVEFKLNNDTFKQIPQAFSSKDCASGKILTLDFVTPVYATDIRIVIKKYLKWPSCRFDFIYNNVDERNDWQGINNIDEINKKIIGTTSARLDNQLDINVRNFFVPTRDCQTKDQCWSGAEFCEPKMVSGFSTDQNDLPNGTITEAFVDYSLDGLLFTCYKACQPITLTKISNIVFDQPLKAKKIRVHPSKWTGSPQVQFSFDYS